MGERHFILIVKMMNLDQPELVDLVKGSPDGDDKSSHSSYVLWAGTMHSSLHTIFHLILQQLP